MNIETRTRRRDAVSKISSGVTALSRPFNLPLFPLFIEARARARARMYRRRATAEGRTRD